MTDFNEQQRQWAKIVARAWEDEAYKKDLLAGPKEVLEENGIQVPEGFTAKVQEAGEKEFVFVLPPKPSDEDFANLGDERLSAGNLYFSYL